MIEAILLLIFGYFICGIMLLSAATIREAAIKEMEEARQIKKILLNRRRGKLFLRNRRN